MSSQTSCSLLLVDDDQVLCARLAKAFCRRGFLVEQADSFLVARDFIAVHHFDVAVIDLQLGDGLGLDLLPFLFSESPGAKAVILTGYGTISTAVEAVKRGAVQYLTKPTNAGEILGALSSESPKDCAEALPVAPPTLAQVEWEHMQRILEQHDGNITKAAKALGIHRRSLQRKLSKDPGKLL